MGQTQPDASSPPSLEDVDIVFAALAHPARRHVLLLLSHLGGELSSGYLAAKFQHSWPTTTRHLKVVELRTIHDTLLEDEQQPVAGGR